MVIREVRVMVDALKTPSKTVRQINTYIAQQSKETQTVTMMDFLPKSTVSEKVKNINTEILRQYFINHPQSIDKYTFLQNSAFTHWVKEKCSKMC